jgi:putative restriction endonuclease
MPAISAAQIVDAIAIAIAESGFVGQLASSIRRNPRRFIISGSNAPTSLTVYCWTLTPGGRATLPNEYRIQMTSVESPLLLSTDGPTILIGYEPDLNLFAGFDLREHRTFTIGSPSVQIDRTELRRAETDGLSFHRKTNGEIAVGIRPDMFMAYATNAQVLHRIGRDANVFGLLNVAVHEQPAAEDIEPLSAERQRIITEVSRLSRAADFRQRVLFAYGNKCAVTRVQLRLVDAAHILPVGAPGSSDHVRNGITLAPTYHRAFDAGLIYLDEQHRMQLNETNLHRLEGLNLSGGIETFRANLGQRIFLPPDPQQRPGVEFIRRANRFRHIPL